MPTFDVSMDLREEQDGWLIIASDEVEILQFHYQIPYQLADHFTLFWRGIPDESDLQLFIRETFYPHDELLGTLLFFASGKVYLRPHSVDRVPSESESDAIGNSARRGYPLKFIRYEVFSRYARGHEIENCRYAIWGDFPHFGEERSEAAENEIGVYAAIHDLQRDRLHPHVSQLLANTVIPKIQLGDAPALLDYALARFGDVIESVMGGRT